MKSSLFALIIVAMGLTGCGVTNQYSGDVYTGQQVKKVQRVTYGTLQSARAIKIDGSNDSSGILGTIGGAVIGGFLGNTIGGGTGKKLATATGGIAGAVVGSAIEKSMYKTDGIELEIRLDNGENIIIVQKDNTHHFKVGDRLRIVSDGVYRTVSKVN